MLENHLKRIPAYDEDHAAWAERTAELLCDRQFAALDLEHLIDEVEDMSRREKRSLASNLRVVLMHLLKYQFQPERRSGSWLSTIREHRIRLAEILVDSPSLANSLDEQFHLSYAQARRQDADETGLNLDAFPIESPFTPAQCLNEDFLPE
jgi:predicted DNA-binding ribbon-helix-helix protein